MGNEKSLIPFLKKITLVVGVLVLCLSCVIWIILYANASANVGWLIPVRRFYHERLVEPRKLPDELPYVIQVRGVTEGVYEYELWGRIVSVDYATYTMMIVDKRKREWRVQMIHPPYHEANKVGIEIHEFEIERASGNTVGRARSLVIDRRAPEQTEQYLVAGDMMSVVWREQMKLAEVLRRNHNGDYLVVVPGDIIRPIRKVVGK